MPNWVIFLATVRDPARPATVFGQGTAVDPATLDPAWLGILRLEGKVTNTIVSATDPSGAFEPGGIWPGHQLGSTG